jgi:HSP20 family protein
VARNWLDILQEMEQWSRDLDRFMTHVNTRSHALSSMNYLTWSPAVNIYETEDTLLVLAEVAGVEVQEVNIKYEGNRLLVWGQRRQLVPENIRAVHRMEIQLGPFAFIVELPGTVTAEGAEARLESGILEIRLPRRSTASSGVIPVRRVTNANESPVHDAGAGEQEGNLQDGLDAMEAGNAGA